MQKKTLYLAGKITGDPFYRSKFYEAQKKLEDGGFIVVNPALLPSEGFTWEAYMRMSGAMLTECAEICFLPDWKESKGAKSGVPDLCLPVARGGNHGLYIELKRQRGGRIGEEQVRWINGLLKQGYAAAICKGWQEAADVIIDYLRRETEG